MQIKRLFSQLTDAQQLVEMKNSNNSNIAPFLPQTVESYHYRTQDQSQFKVENKINHLSSLPPSIFPLKDSFPLISPQFKSKKKNSNYLDKLPEANPLRAAGSLNDQLSSLFPPACSLNKLVPSIELDEADQKDKESEDDDLQNKESENCISQAYPKLIYKKQSEHLVINLNTINPDKLKSTFFSVNQGENLLFESRFESGNLAIVNKVDQKTYQLIVQQDINTNGYTQWFYFRVNNKIKEDKVKFLIGNFYKKESLFQKGMKLSIFSIKQSKISDVTWVKGGENIKYFQSDNHLEECADSTFVLPQNNIVKKNHTFFQKESHILEFTHSFKYDDDTTFFAYSVPYTYSDLQRYIQNTFISSPFPLNIKHLGFSLQNNPLYLLTITSPTTQFSKDIKKKGIFITARVHPGETVSSFIMEGVIEFLLGKSQEAQQLRDQFIFKIIPMLNPDGVIHGNYRCSLVGCDLNRRWLHPNEAEYPEVYLAKKALNDFSQKCEITAFCDLHGHSKKNGFFIYGCEDELSNYSQVRELPCLLSQITPWFEFKNCCYYLQKSRESTSRQTIFREFQVDDAFTLEASFHGACLANKQKEQSSLNDKEEKDNQQLIEQFSTQDYKEMGKHLCLGFYQKYLAEKTEQKSQQINEIVNSYQNECTEEDLSGSESEPSGDNLEDKDINQITKTLEKSIKKKKKKQIPLTGIRRLLLTSYYSKSPPRSYKYQSERKNSLKEIKERENYLIVKSPRSKQNITKTAGNNLDPRQKKKLESQINIDQDFKQFYSGLNKNSPQTNANNPKLQPATKINDLKGISKPNFQNDLARQELELNQTFLGNNNGSFIKQSYSKQLNSKQNNIISSNYNFKTSNGMNSALNQQQCIISNLLIEQNNILLNQKFCLEEAQLKANKESQLQNQQERRVKTEMDEFRYDNSNSNNLMQYQLLNLKQKENLIAQHRSNSATHNSTCFDDRFQNEGDSQIFNNKFRRTMYKSNYSKQISKEEVNNTSLLQGSQVEKKNKKQEQKNDQINLYEKNGANGLLQQLSVINDNCKKFVNGLVIQNTKQSSNSNSQQQQCSENSSYLKQICMLAEESKDLRKEQPQNQTNNQMVFQTTRPRSTSDQKNVPFYMSFYKKANQQQNNPQNAQEAENLSIYHHNTNFQKSQKNNSDAKKTDYFLEGMSLMNNSNMINNNNTQSLFVQSSKKSYSGKYGNQKSFHSSSKKYRLQDSRTFEIPFLSDLL